MVPASPEATLLRFSTADHAPAQRLREWNEAFGQPLARRSLSPSRSHSRFSLTMTGHRIRNGCGPDTSVMWIAATPGCVARRTPQMLTDGDDNVVLHVQQTGRRFVQQLGLEGTAGPGAGLLTSNADASTTAISGPAPARFVCVALPRQSMKALVPRLEYAFLRTLPAEMDILRLLVGYLRILETGHALAVPDLRRAVVTHIQDLCALAVGATRDVQEMVQWRGLAAARLRAVKEDIARNLGAASLSASALALRQGVTPRYIHKLFEREGTTFSRYVLGQRLVLAHRMLTDMRFAGLTIGAIAYDAGFGDLSTFNRNFRLHFGATPSDVRADAQRPGQ